MELRSALQEVINLVDNYDYSNREPVLVKWIKIGSGRPKAGAMNQIWD
ncbi:hypothetical protein [Ruminiclostridium josui]|nr:hypothetical protein [Ruminiclostridium josui]